MAIAARRLKTDDTQQKQLDGRTAKPPPAPSARHLVPGSNRLLPAALRICATQGNTRRGQGKLQENGCGAPILAKWHRRRSFQLGNLHPGATILCFDKPPRR